MLAWTLGLALMSAAGIAASVRRKAWGLVLLAGVYFGVPRILVGDGTLQPTTTASTGLYLATGCLCFAIALLSYGEAFLNRREGSR